MKRLFLILLSLALVLNLAACAETSAENRVSALTINGEAAVLDADGTLTISSGGTYELAGTLNGQVWVDAKGEDVTLVLNGVDIESGLSSAIYVKKAESVTIELAEGSENFLSDAVDYTYDDETEQEPDGAVFSKADLLFQGGGSLTVEGNHSYAIRAKDNLEIAGGTYTVTAVDTALRGGDSVTVSGGSLTISAGNDGIRASNDTDETLGWVLVSGGSMEITAVRDGIQAETTVTVTGGDVKVTTTGTISNAEEGSAKGLKAGGDIAISGGSIVLNTTDDGVHAGGDIRMTDGVVTITSGDDGMHADGAVDISGGAVTVADSYEGIEGVTISISGGAIRVTSSDDGLNAAGETDDDTAQFGRGGSVSGAQYSLEISGGYVVVDAQGDGLDSNGTLTVSGGVTLVSGPTNDGNGAVDSGDGFAFTITGGVLIAAGSAGMAETPGSASTQNSIVVGVTGSAGSLISIADADGNVLYAYQPTKNYANVLISAPEIETGGTYTVTVGGTASALNEDGYQEAGSVSGGETVGSATVGTYLSTIGNAAANNGFGNFGRQGGNRDGGNGSFGGPGGQNDQNGQIPNGG